MSKTRPCLLCILVLLLQVPSPCQADAAYLQPESVYLGDITELVIEYDNRIPSLYPLDTSALAADFEILEKKSRVSRIIDSDEVVHRMQWRLQLLPLRIGNISVPKLYFGDNSTPPLALEVVSIPPALQSSHDVHIEMEAATLTPYIGQQTQVDMHLYHNTPVSNSRLIEPEIGAALIHRQVEELVYSVNKNGQEFHVLDRGIALFPQTAGELELPPVSYRGTIDATADASQTESSTGPRKILRRSAPLGLRVRAPPTEYSGRFWLPASQLEMSQSWEQAGNELEVGDSLDWTLTIIARGLPAKSLPRDLLTMESGNLRIYGDQPTHSNRFDGRQIIGRLDQRFAVIASRPGAIVLPAVTLKWWDVGSDSEKQARLEARTINVVAATRPDSRQERLDRGVIAALWSVLSADDQLWVWPLLSLLLLAIAITALKWLQPRIVATMQTMLLRRRLIRRLQLCCLSDDADGTRSALLDWGRERWSGQAINGLYQIGNRMASRELSAQLEALDAALYSRQETDWRGQGLWRQIAAEIRRRGERPEPTRPSLPRLYPSR